MNLQTKQDFTALAMRFLSPLLPLYSPGGALLHLGDTGATYPQRTIGMEAFSRPLWALAPLWAGGGRADAFLPIYQRGLVNGTDPDSPEYWGDPNDYDQLFVEMAALACAILETPESVWNPLTDTEKAKLGKWPVRRQSWRRLPAALVRQAVSWQWWNCRMPVWHRPCPICRSAPSRPSARTV